LALQGQPQRPLGRLTSHLGDHLLGAADRGPVDRQDLIAPLQIVRGGEGIGGHSEDPHRAALVLQLDAETGAWRGEHRGCHRRSCPRRGGQTEHGGGQSGLEVGAILALIPGQEPAHLVDPQGLQLVGHPVAEDKVAAPHQGHHQPLGLAAPLAGALLYISKSGDYLLGGAALFALALGMGVPLLVVGASAGTLLPKAGAWMDTVKRFFGVVLLGVAIFLVSPLLTPMLHFLAWAALFIMFAVYLHALDPLPQGAPGYRRFFKGIGILALITGIALIVGALSGGRDVLQPLAGLRGGAAVTAPAAHFQRVDSVEDLERAVRAAAGKPVMLDFYADWCVSCKEMERDTFSAAIVQSRLSGMVTLQADVTQNLDAHKALLKRFDLFGPPGIVFFDRRGEEVKGLRVVGFQPAERFAATLDTVLR